MLFDPWTRVSLDQYLLGQMSPELEQETWPSHHLNPTQKTILPALIPSSPQPEHYKGNADANTPGHSVD